VPAAFCPVRFQVKHTRARAWTYVRSALSSLAEIAAQLVPQNDAVKIPPSSGDRPSRSAVGLNLPCVKDQLFDSFVYHDLLMKFGSIRL
jgi:hypothetical protein